MHNMLACLVSLFMILSFTGQSSAQVTQAASGTAASPVPRLIKFTGTLLDHQGQPLKGPVGVTFSLYAQQSGDAPLWMETQNVELDAKGNYTVLLGSNSAANLPETFFRNGEARWLGVQPERESELPRVLLVSVPYALKAGDATTLGGLPASAFALAGSNPSASGQPSLVLPFAVGAQSPAPQAPGTLDVTTAGGSTNKLAKFDTSTDITSSLIFDNGTNVSIGNTSPAAKLDVSGSGIFRGTLQLPSTATANVTTKGFNSQPLDLLASVFNGTAAVSQQFRWQAEPVNPGLSTASGKLNLLFASGIGSPAETGLSISNKGILSFAPGQPMPTVTGNETVTGNVSANQLQSNVATGTAPLVVKSTTQVLNLNASLLGGLPASVFATRGANAFIGNQSITGNVGITSTGSGIFALDVFASTAGVHSPNARFGSNGSGDSNSIQVYNGSGITEIFQAGFPGAFVPGAQPGDGGLRVAPGKTILFGDSGLARMTITQAGYVGIGTSTPSFPLHVVASSGYVAKFEGFVNVKRDLTVDGCVVYNGGSIGTCSSDVRLKKNIQPFSHVLDKLIQLQPVSYNWRVEEFPQFHFGSSRTSGLIAQEVEKVFPEMVSFDKDGFRRVNYGELPYLILQAIRELKAEKDKLQEEMKTKEAQWEERFRAQEQRVSLQQVQEQVAALEARLALVESRGRTNHAISASREMPKGNDGGGQLEAQAKF